jgi:hypothetical protein
MHTLVLALLASTARADNVTIADFVDLLPAAWSTAPASYATAYSPCLDAIIINYRSSGCKMIAQDDRKLGPGSVGLICVAPEKYNGYAENEHVIFYTDKHTVQDFPGWDIFCVDPNITSYIPEPSNKKWETWTK